MDKLRDHLRRKGLAPLYQIQVKPARRVAGPFSKRPVRKITLDRLAILVIILQILPVIVIGKHVHNVLKIHFPLFLGTLQAAKF